MSAPTLDGLIAEMTEKQVALDDLRKNVRSQAIAELTDAFIEVIDRWVLIASQISITNKKDNAK